MGARVSSPSRSSGESDELYEDECADWTHVLPRGSKREYLLAQIRQKNAIIESLLKQVRSCVRSARVSVARPPAPRFPPTAPDGAHTLASPVPASPLPHRVRARPFARDRRRGAQIHNPYLATPMSIASYRMATSPTDQNNQNVLAWLERLQQSVQSAGGSGGAGAFRMESRAAEAMSEDSDEEDGAGGGGEPTERGSVGHPEDDEPLKDAEDRPTAIPSETVPIGLIANLALDNRPKRKKRTPAKPKEGESSDDDVVRAPLLAYFARARALVGAPMRVGGWWLMVAWLARYLQGFACDTFFDPGTRVPFRLVRRV